MQLNRTFSYRWDDIILHEVEPSKTFFSVVIVESNVEQIVPIVNVDNRRVCMCVCVYLYSLKSKDQFKTEAKGKCVRDCIVVWQHKPDK